MTRIALAVAAMLAIAGCSDMAQVCEEVEPFRPIIRGAVTAVEPIAAIPFMVTRQVSCADAEGIVERLRNQR